MIEIPETNVLAEQINGTIIGKTIMNATANASPHKFAFYSCGADAFQGRLSGKTVTAAYPGTGSGCGTDVEILAGDMLLSIGTPIKYHAPGEKLPAKHQLLLEFDDFSHISCTVQMWGSMNCFDTDEAKELKQKYADAPPTPYSDKFDEAHFDRLRAGHETLSAKAFLATEQRIPGLGNGTLQDILFNARIHPKRKLETLSDSEFEKLFSCVKSVLSAMRFQGGRDTEKDLFGCSGGYKTILSSKTLSKSCPVCGDTIIREAYLGGNIYYCPTCQPRQSL